MTNLPNFDERLKKIEKMLRLQENLNNALKKNFERESFYIVQTIISEMNEFTELLNYKWWKHYKGLDKEECKKELIDVWHFIMTLVIDLYFKDKTLQEKVNLLYEITNLTIKQPYNIPDDYFHKFILTKAQILIKFLLNGDFIPYGLNEYFDIVFIFFNNFEEFYKYYMCKCILNLYRNKRGYADGTYKWKDKEHLIIDKIPVDEIINDAGKIQENKLTIIDDLFKNI